MIYRGACHCGAVRAEDETQAPVRLRADGCSFCSSRGVKSASEPSGSVRIESARPLIRYRFSHKTADFLICPACGTYVAAMTDGAEGPIAASMSSASTFPRCAISRRSIAISTGRASKSGKRAANHAGRR